MTKLISLAALTLLVALVACGGGEPNQQPTPTQVGQQPTLTPTPTLTPSPTPVLTPTPTPTRQPPTPTPTSPQPTPIPTSPQPAVAEYAETCGSTVEAIGDLDITDGADAFFARENRIADFGRVSPPDELERFHEIVVELATLSSHALKESGYVDLMEGFAELERDELELSESENLRRAQELLLRVQVMGLELEKYDAEIQRFAAEMDAAWAELSTSTRETLLAADCYEEPGV